MSSSSPTPGRSLDQIEVIYPVKDKLYPPDIEGSDQKLSDICYENARKKIWRSATRRSWNSD